MPKKISKTIKDVKITSRVRFKKFRRKIRKAVSQLRMDHEEAQTIWSLYGEIPRTELLLCSDMKARWEGAKIFQRLVLQHRKERNSADSPYYFGTLIDDVGNTSDRAPVVAIRTVRDKAYRALKSLNLNGIIVIEVHALINYPRGGEGRMLLFHAHFIAWANEQFDPADAAKTLNASGAWTSSLGAAPVSIKKITDTKEDLAAVAHYLFKPPHSGKN